MKLYFYAPPEHPDRTVHGRRRTRGRTLRMTAEPGSLSLARARRVAVTAQLLTSPRLGRSSRSSNASGASRWTPPRRREDRASRPWSRLGRRFRVAELERLLWSERSLFEYRAFILPVSELAVHRATMRRYPARMRRDTYVRRYLRENRGFRRYVLERLRDEGPLPRGRSRTAPPSAGARVGGTTRVGTQG